MSEAGLRGGVNLTHRQNFCVGGSAFFIDIWEVIVKVIIDETLKKEMK